MSGDNEVKTFIQEEYTPLPFDVMTGWAEEAYNRERVTKLAVDNGDITVNDLAIYFFVNEYVKVYSRNNKRPSEALEDACKETVPFLSLSVDQIRNIVRKVIDSRKKYLFK